MLNFFLKSFIVGLILIAVVQLSMVFPDIRQEIGITGGIIIYALIVRL